MLADVSCYYMQLIIDGWQKYSINLYKYVNIQRAVFSTIWRIFYSVFLQYV